MARHIGVGRNGQPGMGRQPAQRGGHEMSTSQGGDRSGGKKCYKKENEPVHGIVVCKAVGREIISLNPTK
jgi:hypothetical protein